jgi:hypothetical protein
MFSKNGHKKGFDNISKPCDPAGTRTQDPNIKSVVLYQLSYKISQRSPMDNLPFKGLQKYGLNRFAPKLFRLIINRF